MIARAIGCGWGVQGLCAEGDAGRDALAWLLMHMGPDVRRVAAAFLLRHRHAEARAVLGEVAAVNGLTAFEDGGEFEAVGGGGVGVGLGVMVPDRGVPEGTEIAKPISVARPRCHPAVPNGVVNNDDFFYYLAVFAAGC